MNYPFYYFGAGVLTRYSISRLDMWIKFRIKPTVEQVKAIIEIAPPMLITERRTTRLLKGLETTIVYTSSENKIESWVKERYKKEDESFKLFDKDIEAWLLEVHKMCPIEAVVRDAYGCGYTPSDWHTQSLENAGCLFDEWKKEPKDGYIDEYYGGYTDVYESMIEKVIDDLNYDGLKPKYTLEELLTQEENTVEESDDLYNEANDFTEEEPYFDLTNNKLVPLIAQGLIEGIAAFRKIVQDNGLDESEVLIDINQEESCMVFNYGEDKDEFFRFKLGPVLNRSIELLEDMDGYSYRHALSNWFEDAVTKIPKKVYQDMNLSIDVPEVGGDPYLENYI